MVYAKQVSKAKTVRYTKIESFRFTFSNKSICKIFLTRENNLKNLIINQKKNCQNLEALQNCSHIFR